MCRSTDFHGFYFNSNEDSLKIKSFFIRLSKLHGSYKKLPESLTLVYLPRINEQTGLEVSGKKIRPDSPAFVTLYRVMTADTEEGEGVYGSRERVTASDGVMFEVYFRDEKVLKGIIRKDDNDNEWKLECKCALEREIANIADADMARADLCVGSEGHMMIVDRVDMVMKRKRKRNINGLEEIPEQRELLDNESEASSDGCSCGCSCIEVESGSDGEDTSELDIEMENVRWAVDLGIWVMCLGVGYLVSKASAKSLRRKLIFL